MLEEVCRGGINVQRVEGGGSPRQGREAGEGDGEWGVSALALNSGDAKEEGSGEPQTVRGENLVGTVPKERGSRGSWVGREGGRKSIR